MRDVEVGAIVFLDEDMSDERTRERRETYYLRNGVSTYLRLGVIQGDPEPEPDEAGEMPRPRYIRVTSGYEYPLVGALPVKPIEQSRFWQYAGAVT